MTRGQIAIIKGDKVITSNEFNGDMYMNNGYGPIVIRGLKKVKDKADYQYFVAKFNKEHHHYNDLDRINYDDDKNIMLNFKDNYFDKWFSDYVYIKNLNSDNETIIDKYGHEHVLEPNDIARLYFGELEKIYKGE